MTIDAELMPHRDSGEYGRFRGKVQFSDGCWIGSVGPESS